MTGYLLHPDADHYLIDAPHFSHEQADSEERQLRQLYRAALAAHLDCAASRGATSHRDDEARHRSESRRILMSNAAPWRQWREWLCECADVDPERLRQHAVSMLAPIIEAERAAYVATDEERAKRLSLATHVEKGGKSTACRLVAA
jgi:hypothetical protein